MIDYHVHSNCSGDSAASVSSVCGAAARMGLKEICFTEHVDFEPTDVTYCTFDYQRFRREVSAAREQFADVLEIRLGVEVDFQRKYRALIEEFLDRREFDYVLGAAHYVDGIILEDHASYFPGRTADEAYEPYFENALAAVETGWFDALAHMDVCKRYGVRYLGPLDWRLFESCIDGILTALIQRGMTLEVNTSGIRQSPGEPYPGEGVLRRYRELGGRRVTVGSDAHRAEDVGAGIGEALELIRAIGFDRVDTFRSRERQTIELTSANAAHARGRGTQ